MALCRKIYGNMEVKTVLFGFLLPLSMLNGIESACNYFQKLEAGQTYNVANPGFPNNYKGENHCTWQMESRFNVKINCSVDMPASVNGCTEDILSVQIDGESMQKYCGVGPLILEGKNPIIKLDSSSSSKGGKFSCEIREEKQSNENCKCGWKKVTRIVGGNETGVNEYPMMCGLVDTTNRLIYCGCTIISHHCVVTAAHCIEDRDTAKIGVVVGEHDVTTGKETNATKLFRINNCEIHPKYNDIQNDIAVCKIYGSITYSNEVGPVCLPFQHRRYSFVGAIVTALGWGLKEFGGTKSTTLQKVNLNVISLKNCTEYYPDVTDKNICTYTKGKDTCQMDSGGPALWQDPTTLNLVLAGITSFGTGCGSDEPAIDTRVGPYIGWIESVCDEEYCKIE
ncbi:Venom serine protease 34 [Formica fusca]